MGNEREQGKRYSKSLAENPSLVQLTVRKRANYATILTKSKRYARSLMA